MSKVQGVSWPKLKFRGVMATIKSSGGVETFFLIFLLEMHQNKIELLPKISNPSKILLNNQPL